MTEQAKEARRAYRREWQRKNPDKVRAYNERYWNKRGAAQAAAQAARETLEEKNRKELRTGGGSNRKENRKGREQ